MHYLHYDKQTQTGHNFLKHASEVNSRWLLQASSFNTYIELSQIQRYAQKDKHYLNTSFPSYKTRVEFRKYQMCTRIIYYYYVYKKVQILFSN